MTQAPRRLNSGRARPNLTLVPFALRTTVGQRAARRPGRDPAGIRTFADPSRREAKPVNQFGDSDDTSEDALQRIVFGGRPVPRDVEDVGDFVETTTGRVRLLTFPAVYSNPLPGSDGELVAQEVRLVGCQEENGHITYVVRIDVTADLGPDEAGLVAAAIRDVIDAANRNNSQEQSDGT